MQKAIENFINIEMLKNVPLHKIEDDIIKVERAEIQKARKKQYRDWRILKDNMWGESEQWINLKRLLKVYFLIW